MKNKLSFLDVPKQVIDKVKQISKRADELGINIHRDDVSLEMDILASHSICNLRLDDLIKADDFNFKHDIYGIQRNLDRNHIKFNNFFEPRYQSQGGGSGA